MRTFIAIRLDAELEENLGRTQDRLREQMAPLPEGSVAGLSLDHRRVGARRQAHQGFQEPLRDG